MPRSDEWKRLASGDFQEYRLRVHGLVENPVELSLDELRALGQRDQVTLHHCIQGWSGIAEWTGVPVAELLRLVRPKPEAGAVVFYSFADGQALMEPEKRGQYYDSLALDNARHPQTLLAWGMNGRPLAALHGAPLRLRVENQLGFKMVKWINAIEVVADVGTVFQGEGGFAQDNEYFGGLANI
jgi:DMSO/TMAO reductase YedYZ molybdopterin-dependent catalytic subunit